MVWIGVGALLISIFALALQALTFNKVSFLAGRFAERVDNLKSDVEELKREHQANHYQRALAARTGGD